jgi:hypothetical protein
LRRSEFLVFHQSPEENKQENEEFDKQLFKNEKEKKRQETNLATRRIKTRK